MRVEHDLLGERELPGEALYGIHALRGMENFTISGTPISSHPELISALATVKQAAAEVNRRLGVLDDERAGAIIAACREVAAGKWHEWFVVDVLQGGAGTSTNMNANEVIANRALELLGHPPGAYDHLHPLEHVNASQSTNDAYPTALRIALIRSSGELERSLGELQEAFLERARAFRSVRKVGRTQLQDAVPMTLGEELHAWGVMVGEDRLRLQEAVRLLHEINLGGTAIGTGLNSPEGYADLVCAELAHITQLPLVRAHDMIEATQDAGVFVTVSGTLKRIAVKLSKICNDLRLLASGPRSGLAELRLPPVQAGSSIMPGKVNPVIPEAVNQVAFRVIGADVTVSFAVEAGQLELNAFGPLIAHELLLMIRYLGSAVAMLATRCVRGIAPAPALLSSPPNDSVGVVTALSQLLGYAEATQIARQAERSGRAVDELVIERGLLDPQQLSRLRMQLQDRRAPAGDHTG